MIDSGDAGQQVLRVHGIAGMGTGAGAGPNGFKLGAEVKQLECAARLRSYRPVPRCGARRPPVKPVPPFFAKIEKIENRLSFIVVNIVCSFERRIDASGQPSLDR
jgi:hypothetical protein